MIEDMKVARATCDGCRRRHEVVAPRTTLKACIKVEGWKVGPGDRILCPDCSKEVEVR